MDPGLSAFFLGSETLGIAIRVSRIPCCVHLTQLKYWNVGKWVWGLSLMSHRKGHCIRKRPEFTNFAHPGPASLRKNNGLKLCALAECGHPRLIVDFGFEEALQHGCLLQLPLVSCKEAR